MDRRSNRLIMPDAQARRSGPLCRPAHPIGTRANDTWAQARACGRGGNLRLEVERVVIDEGASPRLSLVNEERVVREDLSKHGLRLNQGPSVAALRAPLCLALSLGSARLRLE